ncbi:uncharacterized protein LOC122969898 [Thunnus albacares]|uniref:uncharacterized protein LOC122969898 n=1 Tax=Thunnus albacares TaxID=8236 RepID=UPI001CF62C50|nr:uncharacterized protein LOC122969898 [Thunnus albacares]
MDVENLDDLMNCDDIWEDEEFTLPRPSSAISEESATSNASSRCSLSGESISTYTTWGSRTDSEISEVITPSYEDEEDETEIESSSRLSIRSEESTRPVSSAVSSRQARDSHYEVLRALPSGPAGHDGYPVFTQDNKKAAAANLQLAGEVIDQVNSVLSMTIQPSMDGGSFSVTTADSCQVSDDKTAKKALEGAMVTMKSFITGRGTTVKRRIQTQNGFHSHNKEEALARQFNHKMKRSLWRKKRIHPAPEEHLVKAGMSGSTDLTSRGIGGWLSGPLELVDYVEDEDVAPEDIVSSLSSTSFIKPDHQVVEITTDESTDETRTSSQSSDFGDEDEEEETFSQISVDQSQPASKCLSNNQDYVAETKASKSKGLFSLFRSIFSKKKKIKNEEQNKKASTEKQTKQRPVLMRLLHSSSTSSHCLTD